jgi:hypothetical protein
MLEHSSVGPPHTYTVPQNLEFPITYLSYIDEVEVPVLVNNGKLAFIGQTGLVQRHFYHLKQDFQHILFITEPEFVKLSGAQESILPAYVSCAGILEQSMGARNRRNRIVVLARQAT